MQEYEYDVAFSFAGEDRKYVEEVAQILKNQGIKVFYDRYEEINLWGKNLYTHLDDIYNKKAKYCVMFVSQHYARKLWTNHERESAQARAFKEKQEYILPVRFDDTEIPGVRETVGYLNLRHNSCEQLAEKIIAKLGCTIVSDGVLEQKKSKFELPEFSLPPTTFSPYKAIDNFINFLSKELEHRFKEVENRGYSFDYFERQGRHCFRVKQGEQMIYFVDFWGGGMAGDKGITFFDGWNEPHILDGNQGTALGRVRWDFSTQSVVIDMSNFSLLDRSSPQTLTKEALLDGIWEKFLSTTKKIR